MLLAAWASSPLQSEFPTHPSTSSPTEGDGGVYFALSVVCAMAEAPSSSPPGGLGTHRLPSIPSLRPIQIPQPILNDERSRQGQEAEDVQPDSGRLSEESYATAFTSTTSPFGSPAQDFVIPASLGSAGSTRNLARSSSIDQLAKARLPERAVAPAEPLPLDSSVVSDSDTTIRDLDLSMAVDPDMDRWRTEHRTSAVMDPLSLDTAVLVPEGTQAASTKVVPQTNSPEKAREKEREKLTSNRLSRGGGYITTDDENEVDSSAYEDSDHDGTLQRERSKGDLRRRVLFNKRSGTALGPPGPSPAAQLPLPPRPASHVLGIPQSASLTSLNTHHLSSRSSGYSKVLSQVQGQSPTLHSKTPSHAALDALRARSHSVGAQVEYVSNRSAIMHDRQTMMNSQSLVSFAVSLTLYVPL